MHWKKLAYKGKSYALDTKTKKLYDYEAYKKDQVIEVGYIEGDSKKNVKVILK